jgi:hypothetical protein
MHGCKFMRGFRVHQKSSKSEAPTVDIIPLLRILFGTKNDPVSSLLKLSAIFADLRARFDGVGSGGISRLRLPLGVPDIARRDGDVD